MFQIKVKRLLQQMMIMVRPACLFPNIILKTGTLLWKNVFVFVTSKIVSLVPLCLPRPEVVYRTLRSCVFRMVS